MYIYLYIYVLECLALVARAEVIHQLLMPRLSIALPKPRADRNDLALPARISELLRQHTCVSLEHILAGLVLREEGELEEEAQEPHFCRARTTRNNVSDRLVELVLVREDVVQVHTRHCVSEGIEDARVELL